MSNNNSNFISNIKNSFFPSAVPGAYISMVSGTAGTSASPSQPSLTPKKPKESIEPIIAYRCWRTEGDCLIPQNHTGEQYQPRKRMEAFCGKHVAPEPDCQCGFYAFPDMESLFRNFNYTSGYVYARVALWGKVQVHQTGYRAQYMYPQLFFDTGSHIKGLCEAWGIDITPAVGLLKTQYDAALDNEAKAKFNGAWEKVLQDAKNKKSSPPIDLARLEALRKAFQLPSPQKPFKIYMGS